MKMSGDQIIEDLQLNEYYEVYQLAVEIIERHCGGTPLEGNDKDTFIKSRLNHDF